MYFVDPINRFEVKLMATRRQKEHSMIVSSEKIIKRVKRDCDRYSSRRPKWNYFGPLTTQQKRRAKS